MTELHVKPQVSHSIFCILGRAKGGQHAFICVISHSCAGVTRSYNKGLLVTEFLLCWVLFNRFSVSDPQEPEVDKLRLFPFYI